MAKRVNTRFLIVLTTAFACLIAAALAVHFMFFRRDAASQVRQGDALMKEGKAKEALDKYRFALSRDPMDKEVLVRYGDAFNDLVADDLQNLQNARSAWRQAVAADPRYEPALERLLASYWQQMESSSLDGELYNLVRETAQRLADVRPGNTALAAKVHVATIRPWLDGLSQVFKKNEVDNSVKALKQLIPRDPANAEIPYHYALARLRAAQEQRKYEGQNSAESNALAAEAGAVMDAVLAEQPANPAMQLRAYQVYSMLEQVERARAAMERRKSQQNAGGIAPAPAPEPEGPSGAKARKALAAALEASKTIDVSDPLYADIHVEAAEFARRDRRNAEAEKIYEDLLAKRPDDQNVRIRYAALLTQIPTKREKAIELLSAEVNVSHLKGARGFLAAQLRAKTLIDLADARIEQARAAADVKQREAVLAQVRSDMDKLAMMMSGDSIPVLRLRGRLQQLEGDPVGSIQTFQRAVNLMQGSTNRDFNLVNELANAYLYAGQTGSAKDLLQEVIYRHEWFVPARLQMAQVLITENKLEDARMHIREAEKQLGTMQADMKEYPAWRAYFDRTALALLSKSGDSKQLDEQFAKMPEGTRQERLVKAGIAQALKKYGEAARLASLVLAEDGKDLAALDALLNAELAAGRKQQALAAVDKALAAGPTDAHAQRMKLAREKIVAQIELADASAEEIYQRNRQLIEQEPESIDRTLKLADLERQHKHFDQAETILLKLHASEPSNVNVLTRLFEMAIARQQWDKAKALCTKLVATRGDGADGLLYQFRLATAQGETVEALRLAKAVRDTRPEFDLGYLAYGQALHAVERYAEAIDQYKQARSRKPLNFDALRGMVECYYAQNQVKEAKELIDEARGLFPENPHFKDLELEHELRFGDPLTVVAEREQIHRQQPDKRENWVELVKAYRRVARVKYDNDAAKKAEVLAKARDLLRQALEKWKGDAELVAILASVLADSNDFAGGEKLLAEYASAEERATQTQPLLVLADYYLRGGKFEQAEAVSRQALKRAEVAGDATGATSIRLNIADFLARFGRYDDALAVLDGASTGSGPNKAELDKRVFRQRLNVLIASGRRDLAEQALLQALARPGSGNDPDLQMTLVAVNFDGGRYDQALERVNHVLKADPENIKVRYFRGQILLRKPRPDIAGAINDLTEVRKRDPQNVGTRLLLADAFRMQGDSPRAIKELEDGLRLQPTSRDIREKLMDLRSDPNAPDLGEVLRLAREARADLELRDDAVWAYREATVWAHRRDWPKAIAAIQDAVKLAPTDQNLRREHQNILLLAEDYKGVLAVTEQVAKDPKAPWWVFLNRGRARHGLKDTAGAVVEFNNGLTNAGDNNGAVEQIVKAMVATVGKDEALRQVMARSGQDPRWKLLAAALYSYRKPAEGGQPSEPPDWANAVRMLDEVQAHFNELTPTQKAQALRIAGPMYQLSRPPEFEKARRAYEQLLQILPNDLFALNNLANLLIDDALVPQPELARRYSQQAYDQVKRAQPFPAAIFDTHGWVLIQCGSPQQVDEGIEILQKVVRQTSMPDAYYHLAEGFLKKREYGKALEQLRLAAQSIPEAISRQQMVSPELEKKIQAATQKVNDLQRAEKGGEAVAR
jgi:tetratricopeptide (TPR) repeat protein